jgi:KDO2-lipid IV(A) lauroyltransferase
MRDGLALRLTYALSRVVFFVLFSLLGLRRAVIRDNLTRSFPALEPRSLRRLRREFLRRQSELAAEVLLAPRLDATELRDRVTLANPAALASAGASRPLILAGSHQGNFEWAQLRVSLEFGDRLLALYKPMRNARAERWFHRMRSRFGARLVPAKSVLAQLAQFRAAAAIGIIADQVPRSSPDRHWTTFLDQPTAFYMGPEILGRALKTQVLFADLRRLVRGRYELRFVPLSSPDERAINADPPGWWWSHRRWKLPPPEPETSAQPS